MAIENKILAKGAKRLRHYIKKMASGATPTIAEYEKYYSTKDLGYPFIRVQNLTETGELYLEDLKYVNDYTHNVYLKRSQVKENDLLVKITGVGRMAVSSVPPIGFEGNINQHSVVIKTENRQASEYIAAFLNSDIGEKLATKRSTGGTRPALDYLALRSIPIVFDQRIYDISKEARLNKETKEKKAKDLLASIDAYLLTELGITLPTKKQNDIYYRSFKTQFKKVVGNRFDPKKYSEETENLYSAIDSSKYKTIPLKKLIIQSSSGDWGDEFENSYNDKLFEKCLVIRATEFDNNFNLRLENTRVKYRLISKAKLKKLDIQPNDFLIEKSGGSPDQPVGRVALLEKDVFGNGPICFSNFIHKFRVDVNLVLPEYLFCYLKLIHNIKLTDTMQSQTNGIRNLIMREYWNQQIVLPDTAEQQKISEKYFELKIKAQTLLKEADSEFQTSKEQIHALLLN